MKKITKWLSEVWKKLMGINSEPIKEEIPEKERLLLLQGYVWELYEHGVPVGYFKNPSRVAAAYDDLHRSNLYYHCNKYGTYKDDKYK